MTVSYFVRYDVAARDPREFLDYYRNHHVPALSRWPGIRRVVLHTDISFKDPFEVNRGRAVLLAQLEFDSQADLDVALGSPERARAREDFLRFPPFEGTVVHQAMAGDEAWRKP